MKLKAGLLELTMDGELLNNGADASLKLMPGRKVVSIAKANKRTEELFTECINDLIREAKANDWSDGLLLCRIQSAAETFGKRMNLEEIVSRATKLLDHDRGFDEETVDAIDSEWMTALVDHAECTTDENMRDIVSAILAGEANKPGSYSKSTVSTLTRMDASQIQMFEKMCRYIVYPCYLTVTGLTPSDNDPVLVLNQVDGRGVYANGAVEYRELMEIEALGLISKDSVRNFTLQEDLAMAFLVGDEYATFGCNKQKTLSFVVAFTRTGAELSRLFENRDYEALHSQLNQKAKDDSFFIDWTACGELQV